MGYWKTKVLPKIKKVFEKNGVKKAAAAEATKSFDDSKEEINKEFEEKKIELGPKVLEIYEASSTEIKTLVKDPTDAGVKKHSVAVTKILEELVKIDFPGSKPVSEASSKFGPELLPGPVLFIFEKISTFVPVEELAAPAAEEPAVETATREIVVEGEKTEDVVEKATEEVSPPPPTPVEEPVAATATEVVAEPVKPAEAVKEEPPKP